MSELTDFLLARIAEDEAVARAAFDPAYGTDALGHWIVVSRPYEGSWVRDPDSDGAMGDASDEEWAIHATRHDPVRVLAECAAKRQVVAQYMFANDPKGLLDRMAFPTARAALEIVLGALASVYADHPDYRQEWKP